MAIKSVTADTLVELAANQPNPAEIQNADQMVAQAVTVNELNNPIVGSGEERSSDAPPEPQSGSKQSAKKSSKHEVQGRIDELTRLRKEAEEFAESEWNSRQEAERRVAELEAQIKALDATRVPEAPKQDELREPQEADFKDISSFTKAWSEYTLKLAEKRATEAREQERNRLLMEVENERLKTRIDAAKAQLSDFDEVIQAAPRDRTIPAHIERAIRESDFGPHLAYHLAKNREEEARIFSMSAAKALLELGKIEDKYASRVKVESTTDPKPRTTTLETTRAPAPVSSIKADSGTVTTTSSQATSFAEYRRLRMEEMRRNRR